MSFIHRLVSLPFYSTVPVHPSPFPVSFMSLSLHSCTHLLLYITCCISIIPLPSLFFSVCLFCCLARFNRLMLLLQLSFSICVCLCLLLSFCLFFSIFSTFSVHLHSLS